MDTKQQLFGLMLVAEEQQKAAGAVLANLTTELNALSDQRAAFAEEVEALNGIADEAVSTIQSATEEAVTNAVRQALSGMSREALLAFHASSKPFLDSLERVGSEVYKAEDKLRDAVQWFSWRWTSLVAVVAVSFLAALWVLGMGMMLWQRHEMSDLRVERERMAAEVAELREQADILAKRGGRAKLKQCGEEKRLCVRIIPTQEYGQDLYILHGY
jgi:hypothetical protein